LFCLAQNRLTPAANSATGMFTMFPSFSRPLLGVDAGAFAVKLVELRRRRGRPEVVRAAGRPVIPDTVAASFDLEQTAAALGPLVESTAPGARVAVALPYAGVALQSITAPRLAGAAALERRALELAQHELSLAPAAAGVDFTVTKAGGGKHNSVLLAACARETVEDLQALLDVHGLTLAVADVDLLAVERGFFRAPAAAATRAQHATALLDLGHTAMRLSVVRGGVVLHRTAHAFGGARLLAEAQRHYGWDAREARRRLWQDELPADFLSAVRRPFIDALAQAAADCVGGFAAVTDADAPREIVLSGGCTALGVHDAVAEQCGLPVRLADPFCAMAGGEGEGEDESFAAGAGRATFAVAAGLALRSFNHGAN